MRCLCGCALVGAAALTAVGVGAGTSRGAYPGRNGLIVFVSNRGGGKALWTMLPDGTDARRITPRDPSLGHPVWSPDGARIAFERHFDLWIASASGLRAHRVRSEAAWPSWGPHGRRLAFQSYDSIGSSRDDGTGYGTVIADNGIGDTSKEEPSWSPTAGRLAYVDALADLGGAIRTVKADGTSVTSVTRHGSDFAPDWAPDGRRIAFVRHRPGCARGKCTNDIYVVSASGHGGYLLARDATQPSWSPDATKLLFVRRVADGEEIFVVDADGSHVTRLTDNHAVDAEPDWQPRSTKSS
jgi:TolB protein